MIYVEQLALAAPPRPPGFHDWEIQDFGGGGDDHAEIPAYPRAARSSTRLNQGSLGTRLVKNLPAIVQAYLQCC